MRTLAIAVAAASMMAAAHAADDLVVKKSSRSVAQTMDRFEAALKEKNIVVAARWDHAAKGQAVGMPLKPTQVIIFGNPQLGTPLMQSNPKVGLDLPLKVLVWEDHQGAVWIGYAAPQALAARYDIKDRDEVVGKITKALDGLTNRAIQP
jgi:uncharacterized protein (DUF302 family)